MGRKAVPAERQRIAAEANARRSEAMTGRPWAPEGGTRGEKVVPPEVGTHSADKNKSAVDKAKAAGASGLSLSRVSRRYSRSALTREAAAARAGQQLARLAIFWQLGEPYPLSA